MTKQTRSLLTAIATLALVGLVTARILGHIPLPFQAQQPAPAPTPPADLVLRNGRIVTVDDRMPEAQALAARGGKIVFVGTTVDVAKFVGSSTQVIDLNGQLAIPR